MTSRPKRLTREDIGQVVRQGRRLNSVFYRVAALKLFGGVSSRFAFVVSAKIAKRAVDRNLVKRRTRHIVHKNLNLLALGWGVVVFIGPGVLKTKFNEVEGDLIDLLLKL